ncbi:Putative GNAT domain, acyl-CoA N-acyltransferase [Colletotrichum destructivum]|uniref:GNAT domain, acyl-CoA N-acyltransferase n=1 Tax=Colletotrichum destructivum TaxID=34406 RepID=A0AAX4IM33_9PEZI|nr:Putative GNAT domain, acyl-CoA N-acyltransferase [Colletotrichum destructivum]
MTLYIRPLSVRDLDQCVTVESAAFPPAEAATREKIEYRLTVCPSICLGLFVRGATGNLEGTRQQGSIPVLADVPEGSKNDRLIAHTISTQSTSPVVKDEDMAVPVTWKTIPLATYQVGHNPDGRTIALHSLAVSPPFQRLGYGKKLMAVYIEEMRRTVQADRISILTYDRLVPYYQALGFTHLGKSQSEYAGVAWHDLAYEFCPI